MLHYMGLIRPAKDEKEREQFMITNEPLNLEYSLSLGDQPNRGLKNSRDERVLQIKSL